VALKNRFKPRKSAIQDRSRHTVDAILEATAHILSKPETLALSTNKIAEKAGVSIGSLYQYFPTKEAIMASLIERYLAKKLQRISDELLDANSLPPDEAIHRLVDLLIDLKIKNLRLERNLLGYFSRSGDLDIVKKLDDTLIIRLESILLSFGKSIRTPNPEWTAFILLQSLRGVLLAASSQRPGKISDPDFREELIRLVKGFLVNDRELI
jgi:AcrR family transcriptional regulator